MTTTNDLEEIIQHGNRGHRGYEENNKLCCPDGFHVSVIAGGGTYCRPRPVLCMCFYKGPGADAINGKFIIRPLFMNEVEHDFPGPFTHLEVGFPSDQPEPWSLWQEYAENPDTPTDTIYAYVPVWLVRDLIAAHMEQPAVR